jgi:hypothetical protein
MPGISRQAIARGYARDDQTGYVVVLHGRAHKIVQIFHNACRSDGRAFPHAQLQRREQTRFAKLLSAVVACFRYTVGINDPQFMGLQKCRTRVIFFVQFDAQWDAL